jgi:1,2-diacylglycerol 3-alpha-glucosyltransferase
MNLGIVTVWDERGAGYVSRHYRDYLKNHFNVFIYNRGYSKNKFDLDTQIYNSSKLSSSKPMSIHKKEFKKWIDLHAIETILFNEQQSWEPILWCKEWKIKTIAYIDYYTEDTIILHDAYDLLICNTKRHYNAFKNHHNVKFYKWGTDLNIFKPTNENISIPTFFHSCGYAPLRKGTDKVLKIFSEIKSDFKLIIHTQIDLKIIDENLKTIIDKIESNKNIHIVNKTIKAPGLYHLADYYLYPTRLEGIGLTLIEAIACGLIPIITDAPPMNEFVTDKISYKIKIDKFYSRNDGYFWPQAEVDGINFKKIILEIIENHKNKIPKKIISQFAKEKLDYTKNFIGLENDIKELTFKALSDSTEKKIKNYELQRPLKHKKILKIVNFFYKIFMIIKNL